MIEGIFLAESKYDHRKIGCFGLEGIIPLETVLIIKLLYSPMILNFLKRTNLFLATSLNEARSWPQHPTNAASTEY